MDNLYANNRLLKKIGVNNSLRANAMAAHIRSMPIHMHDGVELLSVIEGTVQIKISFNSYVLTAGDFLLINSYELHSIERITEENKIILMEMDMGLFDGKLYAFDPDFYKRFNTSKVQEVKGLMESALASMSKSGWEGDSELKMLIREIVGICDQYFQIQAYDVNRHEESPYAYHAVNNERVKSAYEYLYLEFLDKKKLGCFAEKVNLDKCYASRLLKTGMGKSFVDSLNVIRVDRAEVLLLGTEDPIHKISEDLSFANPHYFNQQFRRYFGMAPLAYRKKHRGSTYPDRPMEYRAVKMSVPDRLEPCSMKTLIQQLMDALSESDGEALEIDGYRVSWNGDRSGINILEKN